MAAVVVTFKSVPATSVPALLSSDPLPTLSCPALETVPAAWLSSSPATCTCKAVPAADRVPPWLSMLAAAMRPLPPNNSLPCWFCSA